MSYRPTLEELEFHRLEKQIASLTKERDQARAELIPFQKQILDLKSELSRSKEAFRMAKEAMISVTGRCKCCDRDDGMHRNFCTFKPVFEAFEKLNL